MAKENTDSDYSEYLDAMIAQKELIIADRLARRGEEISGVRLRVLAAREYFGYTNKLKSHERAVIASVQRLVINPDNEKQLYKLLEQDLHLFNAIIGKPDAERQQKLHSERAEIHTLITRLLNENSIHPDVLWCLIASAGDSSMRLKYLRRYTGIPLAIEQITSGFAIIDNLKKELWEQDSENIDSEQLRKSAYITHKAQETYPGYDEQYVFLRIPRGSSPSEIRDSFSGSTLELFSKGIGRIPSRRHKIIDNFAEKLFVLRLKQTGMSNNKIASKLLEEYGCVKAYSEIDDFVATLRK